MKKWLHIALILMMVTMWAAPAAFADKPERPEIEDHFQNNTDVSVTGTVYQEGKETQPESKIEPKQEGKTEPVSGDGNTSVTNSVYDNATVTNSVYEDHGIANAIDHLFEAEGDGNGKASNEALKKVIAKLQAQLVQAGTAQSSEDADQKLMAQLQEQTQASLQSGTVNDNSLQVLVSLKLSHHQSDDAKIDVEKALAQNPNSDALYSMLSQVYVDKKDTENTKVYVDGKQTTFDVQPYIKDNRTLLPVRAVVESLGAKVKWDPQTQTITIVKDGTTIQLVIDSNQVLVNGVATTIDVPAEIKDGRTMVPVRFISEILHKTVKYDAASKMVIVL